MVKKPPDIGTVTIENKNTEKYRTKYRQQIVFQAKESGNAIDQEGIEESDRKRRQRNISRTEKHDHENHKTDSKDQRTENETYRCGAKHALTAFEAEKDRIRVTEHTGDARDIQNGIDGNGVVILKSDDAGRKKKCQCRFKHIAEQRKDRRFFTEDSSGVGKSAVATALSANILMEKELGDNDGTVDTAKQIGNHDAQNNRGDNRIKGENNTLGKNNTVLKK